MEVSYGLKNVCTVLVALLLFVTTVFAQFAGPGTGGSKMTVKEVLNSAQAEHVNENETLL
jgi:hypothetical protein